METGRRAQRKQRMKEHNVEHQYNETQTENYVKH